RRRAQRLGQQHAVFVGLGVVLTRVGRRAREKVMRMSHFTVIALGASMYCAYALSADVAIDAQHAAAKTAAEVCSACHGLKGSSVSPTFPNLAGQTAPYIETQLKAFKDQSRA